MIVKKYSQTFIIDDNRVSIADDSAAARARYYFPYRRVLSVLST